MRWRARGIDYHELWAKKWREKEASLWLPFGDLPACTKPKLENTLKTLLSSCEAVVEVQERDLLRQTCRPQVIEPDTAAELLAKSFEAVLLGDGRCTLKEALSYGLVPEKQTDLSEASLTCTSPRENEAASKDEPETGFWGEFKGMERVELENILERRINELENTTFLKDAWKQSSAWSGLHYSNGVQVDEDLPRLLELREAIGLDPGNFAETQNDARVSHPGPLLPSMISMLEAAEQRRKCSPYKRSSPDEKVPCKSTVENSLEVMEVQELCEPRFFKSTIVPKPGLSFMHNISEVEAAFGDTESTSNLACFEEEGQTLFHFAKRHILEPEETGLAELVLAWDHILAEKLTETQSSEEDAEQSVDHCVDELADPATLYPLEFFKGLPPIVAKTVMGLWQTSGAPKAGELEGSFEQPSLESIDDEYHRLVTYPELRMDSFNFNMLPTVYIPTQVAPAGQATRLFALPIVRSRNLAGDSLYLDWHLSLPGACNQAGCFQFKKKVRGELEPAPIPSLPQEPPPSAIAVLLDLLAAPEPDEADPLEGHHAVNSKELPEGEVVLQRTGSIVAEADGVMQRSSFVSKTAGAMTEDLSFFMQARRGMVRARAPAAAEPHFATKKQKRAPSEEAPEDGSATVKAPASPPLKSHWVKLPEEHEKLLTVLQTEYSALQVNEKARLSGGVPAFGVDAIANRQLMSMVKDAAAAAGEDEQAGVQQQRLRLYATLWTLRQTAANLVEYGLRVAFLYLEHSLQSMPFMTMAVLKSKTALEAHYGRVEAGLAIDSPKLKCLQDILRASAALRGQAEEQEITVLILADRRAFISMYNELVAGGLRPFQLDRDERILRVLKQGDAGGLEKLAHAVQEALTVSNCLLVSFEYLKAPFPLHPFRKIVQYSSGQLSNSDADLEKIQAVLAEVTSPKHVLLVRSRQQEPLAARDQVDVGDPSALPQAGQRDDRVPLSVPATHHPLPQAALNGRANSHPATDTTRLHRATPLVNPGTRVEPLSDSPRRILIVANMLDSELSMRRGLYQAVVALEKTACAQVVERDLVLAVDLIVHGATCLTIVTPERLGLDALCLDDAHRLAEGFPRCFQEVVDSHLKAVSFAYKTAVLIFEGPPVYLRATFPELTPLHAAALTLDLNLQCLLSDGPETTNRLSLNLINSVRTQPKRAHFQHPDTLVAMPEAAALLEDFLTAFPCLNSVSAHAIMTSGVKLAHFVQLSEEQQLERTRRFDVPVRSLRLFTLQFLAHSGTELDTGMATEEVPIQGPEEVGFRGRAAYASVPESGGVQGYRGTEATGYPPVQAYRVRPPSSAAQQQGHNSFQPSQSYGTEGFLAYDQNYRADSMSCGREYLDFPTAAEIAAGKDPECGWPSAHEIAEQEEDSPPLRELGYRGKGRRDDPQKDDLEMLLPEDLYRDLPSLGQTDFDRLPERDVFARPVRHGLREGVGQPRFAPETSGRPQGLGGAPRVAAWQDPRDAGPTRGAAGDAVEQWLGRKRKAIMRDTRHVTPVSVVERVGQKKRKHASMLFDCAPLLPTHHETLGNSRAGRGARPFDRAGSDDRVRVARAPREATGPQGSRDSRGSTGDAYSDDRMERPELQEAIAHFRMYEYVPESSRQAGDVSAPQREHSDGSLSTPRPHLMDVPQDKKATEVLGYKRHGHDKQTRLSWGSTPSRRTSLQRNDSSHRVAKAGSFATM